MVVPWPPRWRLAASPVNEPVAPPAAALAEGVCRACCARIRKVKGRMIPEYWETMEPLAPNVALSMECGKNPRPGMGPGSFHQHYPR